MEIPNKMINSIVSDSKINIVVIYSDLEMFYQLKRRDIFVCLSIHRSSFPYKYGVASQSNHSQFCALIEDGQDKNRKNEVNTFYPRMCAAVNIRR